jgi:hypothetical protein
LLRILTFAIVLVSITRFGFSQTVLDTPLQILKQQPLTDLLLEIESRSPVKIFYLDEWLEPYQVDERFNGSSLRETLDVLLEASEVSYTLLYDYALVFSRDPTAAIEKESILSSAIVQRKMIERKVIGDKTNYRAGRLVVLSGTVRDQDADKMMEGVSIFVNTDAGAHTDINGRFQLRVMPGSYVLTFHHSRYDDRVIDLEIYADGLMDIRLQETPVMLDEVVISDEMVLENAIGKTSISVSQMKRVPTFLGEVDVIKQVQSQPGVTTVGEAAAGFNVRGGSADQNLVLYDGVPIFNTSHALGFFTAFNPEAISEISFYRGGVPAQFGGRASSVLDIVSRQGDFKKWSGAGGIGIVSSHLMLGGPIKKDTTSVLVSLRSSYSDWMFEMIKSEYADVSNSSVQFYDGSIKLTHKLSDNGQLTLSGYTSHDAFSLADDTTYSWENVAASLRYDHTFSTRLFSSLSFSYGAYAFELAESDPANAFDLRYSITYPAVDWDFQLDGKHELTFGLKSTYYTFEPGRRRPSSPHSNAPFVEMDSEKSLESAVYIGDGFEISESLYVQGGLRFSVFNRFGPSTVYRYRADAPREIQNIVDSVVNKAGDVFQTYVNAEPRISLRWSLSDKSALKIGYQRMSQYMHLITNTAAIMPTDIWQSSNAYFKPQVADQVSIGLFKNFSANMFETFVETYYKQVENMLDFKDGANLILNRNLETALIATEGTSYGAEFSVSKVRGRLQGSLNYTWSRSLRLAKSRFSNESINEGKIYPSNHDQPHVVNMNWRYGISRRIFFSGTFVAHSGRPVSLPTTVYNIDGVPVSGFSERNQYRIPHYHRLDLAFIIEGNHKRRKVLDGNWIFSFYNVYARKNAYSVFFADDGTGTLKPYKLSLIGTVIPSVSYTFRF